MVPQRIVPTNNGPARPMVALDSPSLAAARPAPPAYELKFLLTEAEARAVEDQVRETLSPDAHADPALGGAYRTTSLYCDTAALDVFRRVGPFRRRKHRLRRYGDAGWVFLERKTKAGDRVRKLRTAVPDAELPLLAQPLSATTWPGHWFHRQLYERGLHPVCRVAYERVALVGLSAEGPLRLTLDRHIRGVLTGAWDVTPFDGGVPILTGQVVCEFKYQGALPSLFKGLVQSLQLTPRPVSKYRTFLAASGLPGGESADA